MAAKFLILLGLLGLVAGSRVQLQQQARAAAWLKAHRGDPDDGELAELAKADPNSYAIVKALLAKQKMGLLNTNRAQKSDDEAAASSSSENSESTVENSYSSSSSSSFSSGGGGNWLNWKPRDDSAIVGNVLGQVAALRGAAAPQAASQQQGLISQQQQTSRSTSEMVTDADTSMDLSFGAYKQAATEQTKSTFDQDAESAKKGLGKMEADAANNMDDLPSSFNGKQGNYYGIDMNWGQDGTAAVAPAKPAHKAGGGTGETNSYLSQYPLSMSQTGEQGQPQGRRSPAQILGAWLQKSTRAEAPQPERWWHHIDRHQAAPEEQESATNNYMDMLK